MPCRHADGRAGPRIRPVAELDRRSATPTRHGRIEDRPWHQMSPERADGRCTVWQRPDGPRAVAELPGVSYGKVYSLLQAAGVRVRPRGGRPIKEF